MTKLSHFGQYGRICRGFRKTRVFIKPIIEFRPWWKITVRKVNFELFQEQRGKYR